MPQLSNTQLFGGWGRSPSSASALLPTDEDPAVKLDALAEFVASAPDGTRLLARGMGRSYGDAANCAGGYVSTHYDFRDIFEFNPTSEELRASSGFSLDEIMRRLIPEGYFVYVTPGTRYVTLGGAIAADIHGKNHHKDGSFINHVESFELITPSSRIEVNRSDPLFWATAGGMGMTGIITAATIRLKKVQTSYIKVTTQKTLNVSETIEMMQRLDDSFTYSVAWMDSLASGNSLGRSVITWGEHASEADLEPKLADNPLSYGPSVKLKAPDIAPSWLLNMASIRAFNEAWYRKAPKNKVSIESIPAYFHPLDAVSDWNRLYGRTGFLQYQFQVPLGQEETLISIIHRFSRNRTPSFLSVLKRFGPSSSGHLSFPQPGWTLALDIPIRTKGLSELLDGIDFQVAEAGGRVYFAKDSRLIPELVPKMYPRLDEWRDVVEKSDPKGIFLSDLGRRLSLRSGEVKKGSLVETLGAAIGKGPNL